MEGIDCLNRGMESENTRNVGYIPAAFLTICHLHFQSPHVWSLVSKVTTCSWHQCLKSLAVFVTDNIKAPVVPVTN